MSEVDGELAMMNINVNKQWVLEPRQICDLELIMNQGFAPLRGFLDQKDYHSVLAHMRLADGQIWPMPITLDVTQAFADDLELGECIDLCDPEGQIYAYLTVRDKWNPDKEAEAQAVFTTVNERHPGVHYLLKKTHPVYVGGDITPVQFPSHYDFIELRLSPAELKQRLQKLGWRRIVGFQTRNPMHRAHLELTLRAAEQIQGHVLLHPVVGMTKPNDIDHYTRVRCYQKLLQRFPANRAMLSLLPLAMRMGGPREALWHALIRRNYGCTHFIVGRDHAGPGSDQNGKPFYDPYAAQELVATFQHEIGIEIVPFQEMVYVQERKRYAPMDEIQPGETVLTVSGTELRRCLHDSKPIPEWFSYPEIIAELHRTHPPRTQQGFTLFFTGLSGSGKSTIAKALCARLLALGGRSITILDGDLVRRHLSSELGFSRAHRDLNIRRIGFVASEITKAGGVAICAAIAPYAAARYEARQLVSEHGGFFEIYLDTPIGICVERDPKGLYAKAKQGLIKGFTGIDDPYEKPIHPELVINTANFSVAQEVNKIMTLLIKEGYISEEMIGANLDMETLETTMA